MAIINLANSSLLNICYFLFSVLQTTLQRASFYLYLCILNFLKCSINWNFRKKFNPKVTFLRGNCGNTNPYARTDDCHKPDYPRKRLCILIQVSVTFPKLAHFSKIFFCYLDLFSFSKKITKFSINSSDLPKKQNNFCSNKDCENLNYNFQTPGTQLIS